MGQPALWLTVEPAILVRRGQFLKDIYRGRGLMIANNEVGLFEVICLGVAKFSVYLSALSSLPMHCTPLSTNPCPHPHLRCIPLTCLTIHLGEKEWGRKSKTETASKPIIISLLVFLRHQSLECLKARLCLPLLDGQGLTQPQDLVSMSVNLSESGRGCRDGGPVVFSLRKSLLWMEVLPLQASSLKTQILRGNLRYCT